MSPRSNLVWFGLVVGLVAVVTGGCVTAPTAWRTEPERVAETACGGYARVKLENGEVREGEVLAADATVLYIHDGEALHSLPVGRIQNTVTVYSNTRGAEIGGWTVGGALSTLSHGLTLMLSTPIWLISGISASAVESSSGRDNRNLPGGKRARFPQGLPPSFEKEAESLDPGRVDSTSAPELAGGCPPSEGDKK